MSEKKGLSRTDLVVRFDPATKSVSFLTVSPVTGAPLGTAIHQVDWPPAAGLNEVVDVGAAICAHMFASHQDRFCSSEDWERIAAAIRVATGRDGEEGDR